MINQKSVMQESDLKLLFDSGNLARVTVAPYPMREGWCLQFDRRNGDTVSLDAQRVSVVLMGVLVV